MLELMLTILAAVLSVTAVCWAIIWFINKF